MGQSEMINALKKSGKWMGTKELSKKTGTSQALCNRALLKLYKYHEVLRKQEKNPRRFVYLYA